MPRRPDVDYTALPLPANLPETVTPVYQDLMRTVNERNAMEHRLEALNAQIKDQREAVLDAICPVGIGADLPIARNVLVEVDTRELTLTEEQGLRWSVNGRRITFRDGTRTVGMKVQVTQAEYEALPETVRAQTRESMESRTGLVVDLSRPLTWTDPSSSMFEHLKSAFEHQKKATVHLPSTVWNDESSTRRIYLGLIKQGVIELGTKPQGGDTTPSDPLRFWFIRKGPRYDAFVEALAQERSARIAASAAEKRPVRGPKAR